MKKNKLLPIVNFIALISLIIIFIVTHAKPKKETLTYVDNTRLFNEFNMTNDIKLSEEKKFNKLKKELDGLITTYQSSVNKDNTELQQSIALKSKNLQELQNKFVTNLNLQVWSRLNDYLKLYGEDHQYKIIFGSTGNGNIMYAKDLLDITEDFLIYANNKYEGLY